MTLTARIKPSGLRELRDAGRSFMARALCGYPRCREELALVTLALGPQGQVASWSATLAAGYREHAPGQWALGHHAQRSHRHAPRRPRYTGVASGQPAPGYVHNGAFLVRGPAHQPALPMQTRYDPQGRLASAPQELALSLAESLTMTCARCGRVSTLTALSLIDALVEAHSDAANGNLRARGSAEATDQSSFTDERG